MVRCGTPFYERVGREWMEERYIRRRMLPREIAAECGASTAAVTYALQKFGLQGKQPALYQALDPEELARLYHGEDLSLDEVGERLGTTATTIAVSLRHHGIALKAKGYRRGAGEAGAGADRGRREKPAPVVEVDCWRCRWRGRCLDWPVDAPCRAARCRVVSVETGG